MMNRKLVLIFWGSLFYVEYRWGLTLNRFFIVSFLIAATMGAYYALLLIGSFFVKLKSSRLLPRPIPYYRRKLFIYVMVAGAAFYGFYRTQLPGQLEMYRAILERELAELRSNQNSHDYSYTRPSRRIRREKLVGETALEASRFDERQISSREIHIEITMGWNTATVDAESDNFNWEKATDLLKKYPNYIQNANGQNIRALKVLEETAEYYGRIVSFKGQAYGIQQLPPEDSVAQFFDGNCYHTMLAVRDKKIPVIVSAYIVGNSSDVPENSTIKVKGFIYGQATLLNSSGNASKGLAFVGFRE